MTLSRDRVVTSEVSAKTCSFIAVVCMYQVNMLQVYECCDCLGVRFPSIMAVDADSIASFFTQFGSHINLIVPQHTKSQQLAETLSQTELGNFSYFWISMFCTVHHQR